MGKTTKTITPQIEVAPDFDCLEWRLASGEKRRAIEYKICESIVADIQRHVDGIDYALVVGHTQDVCEFCGYPWHEASDTYNGGCCEQDEANAPSAE